MADARAITVATTRPRNRATLRILPTAVLDGHPVKVEATREDPDGTTARLTLLVRPHPAWRDHFWTLEGWTAHGTPRATVEKNGLEPMAILDALDDFLAGCDVVAEDPWREAEQLRLLRRAAGRRPGAPSWRIVAAIIANRKPAGITRRDD